MAPRMSHSNYHSGATIPELFKSAREKPQTEESVALCILSDYIYAQKGYLQFTLKSGIPERPSTVKSGMGGRTQRSCGQVDWSP